MHELEAVLLQHDPIRLNFGDNTDEYRPEAETIALAMTAVESGEDLVSVVHREFVTWFGASIAGPPTRYADIAHDIWAIRRATP